ncbi:MAG TPA: hypothetical protein VFL66_05685 [Gaiellaceae bacterium]|nr:hypothetical protein [Gaiellaceae bacterium]
MDASSALADLTEVSSQIETATLLDAAGAVLGSTLADAERAERVAAAARRLLEEAGPAERAPTQLQAATPAGSVFVVREGGRLAVATTGPEPTVGLVFYDLKSCLRNVEEPKPKPKRPRKKKTDAEA